MTEKEPVSQAESQPELLMRGLLRAYYWMDESLQNGLQKRRLSTSHKNANYDPNSYC